MNAGLKESLIEYCETICKHSGFAYDTEIISDILEKDKKYHHFDNLLDDIKTVSPRLTTLIADVHNSTVYSYISKDVDDGICDIVIDKNDVISIKPKNGMDVEQYFDYINHRITKKRNEKLNEQKGTNS